MARYSPMGTWARNAAPDPLFPSCMPEPSGERPLDPPQVEIDEPAAWIEAIERILSAQRRRVLVLGSGDVGKSTFARLILRAASASRRTALLDLDVGQKIVGPPACEIGRAHV